MKEGGDWRPLLTEDELRAKLNSMLASGFTERGNMFLPTTALYNKLHSNLGLHEVFIAMCRWLGVKPRQVTVVFSQAGKRLPPLYADGSITIDHRCKDHPYMVGALLAIAAIMYYADHYSHDTPDIEFTEFATIETGLGLWVVNGLRPKNKHSHAVYQVVKGLWLHKGGLALSRYSPELYAHSVAQFAHANHILPETYLPSVSAQNRYLFPAMTTSHSTSSLPEPRAIVAQRKAARQLWLRYFIVATIVASIVCFGLYFWQDSRPDVSVEEQQSEQSLAVIKKSLEACQDQVVQQQNNFDPNDLFLTREIDATKNRCKSLLNEYNYALNQHEHLYGN